LFVRYWPCANSADSGLGILCLDRIDHIAGGQTKTGQPIGPKLGSRCHPDHAKQHGGADR
jgi:hypothetical protein